MSGIPISKKHGVNPTIPLCFFCGEEKNEVALLGKLPDDAEAPRNCVLDMEPCGTCAERRKTHVHLIVIKDGQAAAVKEQRQLWEEAMSRRALRKQTPFIPCLARARCAYWLYRDEIARFVDPPSLVKAILQAGWTFIPEEAAQKIGLDQLREEAEKTHPDAKEVICHNVQFTEASEEEQDEKV